MADGRLRITASFEGAADLASDYGDGDGAGSDLDQYLRVKHSDTACPPCLANHNPYMVPFPGCRGNIKTELLDDGKKGNLCRCTVEVVVGDDDGHHDF